MTCRRSSHQASTEELEKRPSRQRQRQPTTTRTSHAHMQQPLGPDLLLRKSNRNREQLSRLSRKAYLLQRPLPATTGSRSSSITTHAITTNRSKQGLRNPSLESGSNRSSFAVDRQTLSVCTSRPAKNAVVSPQNATTSTRNRSTGEISP